MRAQPWRCSSTAIGSPRRAWVTCSASSLGSARTGATSATTAESNWRRLIRGLLRARLEHGLALLRLDLPRLDLLGPVTRDGVPGRERAKRRHIVAAARGLDVRTAGVEAAGPRRVRRAR